MGKKCVLWSGWQEEWYLGGCKDTRTRMRRNAPGHRGIIYTETYYKHQLCLTIEEHLLIFILRTLFQHLIISFSSYYEASAQKTDLGDKNNLLFDLVNGSGSPRKERLSITMTSTRAVFQTSFMKNYGNATVQKLQIELCDKKFKKKSMY